MGITVDPIKYPNCFEGYTYAVKIVSGELIASIPTIGACRRFLSDLEKNIFPFNWDKSERFLRLAQQFNHIKGEWKTDNVTFEPWQCWLCMNILGFEDTRTGKRRFRTAYIELPRGSGKSLLASILSLYFIALDDPKGNEISCFATTSDIARVVLDSARAMAAGNPSFLKNTGTKVLAHCLKHESSNSIMRARSSEHGSMDGLNDILSILDETHAISRELYDVVVSGMNKRNDSLLLAISTAGFSVDGVGHDLSVYTKKICSGGYEDDQFFGVVYTIDEGDDIFSERTWRKANPNFGISVDPINFESKANKAKEVPSDLANFKVKFLNIWLSEAKAFFDTAKWDLCADPNLTMEQFAGEKCIIGIDLASKIDLTSFAYIFRKNGKYYIFDKSFIPEETVKNVRSTLYDNCIGKGYLIATKGEAIQYTNLFDMMKEDRQKFKIQEALFDPWNATEFAQKLIAEKINTVEFRMNTSNLSEPTKTLDALIRKGEVVHNGSPLLRWCLGNVVCKEDAAGNVYPRKSHEKLKIDPIMAIIMALASWTQKEQKESIYESRGLRVL